jgi:hypothetical protein
MPFGGSKSRRQQAARKHAEREHECPICGRTVRGNGYYGHFRACKAKHCNTYLHFACGARLPAEGYLPYKWQVVAKDLSTSGPREDGRYKYVCVDTEAEIGAVLRPVMPGGTDAPCLFRCPCPERAGREEVKCWPESEERKEKLRKCREARDYGSQWDLWRFIVTCYPEEIDDSATRSWGGAAAPWNR